MTYYSPNTTWAGPPTSGDPVANILYQDYLNRLRQQFQNKQQGVYNTMADQDANARLTALGLNLAGDRTQQQLGIARSYGDIAQLQAQMMRQAQNNQLDLARGRFNIGQNRLDMQDRTAALKAQQANSEITPGYERAKKLFGGY